MSAGPTPHVLYIGYWGALEPLGRSLVVPAVARLARGVRLSLITFEKPADLARGGDVRTLRADLEAAGVSWFPLRYHKRPKVPATAFDVLHGTLRAVLRRLRQPVDLVHARTFVAGPMGLLSARLLRVPFVYHNEGFYPDEQVDGGVWREGSSAHRLALAIEGTLYDRADGIITLSARAREIVLRRPAVERRRTPVIVVPSVVDLDLFRLPAPAPAADGGRLRLVYIGSVGVRYRLDAVGRFVAQAARLWPDTHLRVLSPADPGLVTEMLSRGGLSPERWSLDRVPHARMPEALAGNHAGLFFLTRGLSEHGCSPTKIGEYWASGLPVITTPNVSDTDAIVRRERVGVVVEEHTDEAYLAAAEDLRLLLRDPGLGERCRRAAEQHYALEPACERQLDLYRQVLAAHRKDVRG